MKKLVRVSLFVLMALTLSLAIGCKHDSDPEPAKEGSRTPFVGTWVDESGDITCTINADGTFVTQAYGEKYEGKCHVSPDGKTVTATINEVTFTLTSKSEDTLELTLPEDFGGKKVTLTKEGSRTPFVGEWVAESEGIPFTIKADGTFVMESDEKYEGKYHVSPDGKTATVTITINEKEETLTLTLKSEDTLELTMPEYQKMTLTKRVDADFAGQWKSTDGSATATLKDGKFTTTITTTVGERKLEGDYAVVGKTATTSKMEIPAELAGGSDVSASFIMKMVDGNDVMKLTATHGEAFEMTFVKTSSTKSNLTGTWTGKVVVAGNADATIGFADNKATLTLGETTVTSTAVTQDGNFFTITWGDNQLYLDESTGLISVSDKAWLDDGSVFTKS